MGTAWDRSPSNRSPKAQRARQSWDEHELSLPRAIISVCFLLCKPLNFIWEEGEAESLGRGIREPVCGKCLCSGLVCRSCKACSGTEGCGGRGQERDACDRWAYQPDRRTSAREEGSVLALPAPGRCDLQHNSLAAFPSVVVTFFQKHS